MKNKNSFIMMAFLFGCMPVFAFQLETKNSDLIVPARSVQKDDTGITVSYKFYGAIAANDNLYPGTISIDIPGFGHNSTIGEPSYPIRIDTFEIPDGCEANLSVVSCEWTDLGITLSPVRPMLIDSSDEEFTAENVPPVSNFYGAKPNSPVTVSDIQTYRDRNILYVSVMPVKCVNNTETKVCENLIYRVTFKQNKNDKLRQQKGIRHDVDETFMKNLFTSCLDYSSEDKLKVETIDSWKEAPYYLILSTSSCRASVEKFIEWKKCMGFNADAIYSNSWTPTNIKDQIKKIYDVVGKLHYVLLVGDAKSLPPVRHTKSIGEKYDHSSDFTYGSMDGEDDMEQDIIIGRLNVSNSSEASDVIEKIINYERNPTSSKIFYNNAIHAAYFQDYGYQKDNYEDRRFAKTSEDIKNGLSDESFTIQRIYYAENNVTPTNWNYYTYAYGEEISDELLKPKFKWNGTTSDVVNAINSGSFYVLHRGHGSYSGWQYPSLTLNTISNLSNGSLLPVFFNIHCQSGAFGNTEIWDSREGKRHLYC